MLTQFERTIFLNGLDKPGGVKGGPPGSTRGLIVQFAPGTTTLVTPEIKVHGTMTAAETDSNGSKTLRVSINYIVAYAVEPPHDPADWMRIVAHFFQGPVDFADWAESDMPFEPVWNQSPAVAGEKCGMKDGFVHPEFPSGPPSRVQGTGPAVDPYSFSDHAFARCGRSTRT